MAKETVFQHYLLVCEREGIEPTTCAAFGKLVHSAFPGIQCNRKGPRGEAKHHYKHLQYKTLSQTQENALPTEYSNLASATDIKMPYLYSRPSGNDVQGLDIPFLHDSWLPYMEESAYPASYVKARRDQHCESNSSIDPSALFYPSNASCAGSSSSLLPQSPQTPWWSSFQDSPQRSSSEIMTPENGFHTPPSSSPGSYLDFSNSWDNDQLSREYQPQHHNNHCHHKQQQKYLGLQGFQHPKHFNLACHRHNQTSSDQTCCSSISYRTQPVELEQIHREASCAPSSPPLQPQRQRKPSLQLPSAVRRHLQSFRHQLYKHSCNSHHHSPETQLSCFPFL